MKKCISLIVLVGLILALLAEAILTLFQAFRDGHIYVRGLRRAWIPLPLATVEPRPLPARRTTTAVQGRRSGVSLPVRSSHPQPVPARALPRSRSRASAGS
jgi:hypothetical protein